MASGEKKVVMAITDISGYTQFMLSNRTSLQHSQKVITELTKAIIREVEIPLEVSNLQGDAIFLYAIKDGNGMSWDAAGKKKFGEKTLRFFEAFSAKIAELVESVECKCGACKNIDKLRLKIVVHSGEALFYDIGRFNELAGIDVIITHRLLKNSVESDQYLLLTESAYNDIELPAGIDVTESEENYAEIGPLKTYICYPPQ